MSGETRSPARITLLGPITVEISGGWHGELPAQLRKVLAVLALTRDVPLSGEQLRFELLALRALLAA